MFVNSRTRRLGLTSRAVGFIALGLVVVAAVAVFFLTRGQRPQVQGAERQMNTIGSIPEDHWEHLASKRVFFGHQSVGENILDGIVDLMRENRDIQLEIVGSERQNIDDGSGIFHKKIGRNTRPKSKLLAFQRVLEDHADTPFDIALMKFCYVDLLDGDNPEEVFDLYRSTMSELEVRYPETVFIHSTVPIEAVNSSVKRVLKENIKSLIGRPGVVENNSVRQGFNDLLRSTYEGRGWVFDIAQAETLTPDGSVSFMTYESRKVFLMDGRYSNDGGHLNKLGRRRVAEQMLVVLAMAANNTPPSESP